MNPLAIETAVKAALAAEAFEGVTIYTGESYDELTSESLNLIVAADNVQHVAGGLYKANVTVKVTAPALLGDGALGDTNSALDTLKTSITASYFDENWPTDEGTPGFNGVWLADTKASQEKHAWVAQVECVIGISI